MNNGSGSGDTMHTFWAAWRWSGDAKYLQALDYRVARGGPGALANLGENVVDVLGRQQDWYLLLRAEADAGKTGFASLMAAGQRRQVIHRRPACRRPAGESAARVHEHRGPLVVRPRGSAQ